MIVKGRPNLESYLRKPSQRWLPFGLVALILVLLYGFSGDLGDASSEAYNRIPRKIWQTWETDPLCFQERDLLRARTWTAKNPSHRYEVLTDHNDLSYVEQHFGPSGFNRPDIIYTYKSLNAKIIKADLLRYLIMYVEGGVYADIDVEALKPIAQFIPERYDERDIDMVIGVEVDQPFFKDHPILGPKSQSFCQWTFMCKPRLPVIMRLIENILKWLNEVAKKQNVPISDVELDFNEVIVGTGPSAFTAAILAEMSAKQHEAISWETFHNLGESKLVGGILVLTVEAFAAGQGHSESGNHGAKTALIKHHYHASLWPTKHPRYRHPIYGEVERCNWDVECVKMWDANVALFNSLPTQEQLKLIAIKEVDDSRKANQAANDADG